MNKTYAVVELTKEGLFEVERFDKREEAEWCRDDLISTWTHWDVVGCPCQKNFEIFEVA